MSHTSPVCTIPCELRDYPEWHHGRQMYCVWTLPLRDRRVLERVQAAQQQLSPWLHQGYRRQAHITLFVCGFDAQVRHRDDDFTGQMQLLQCEAMEMLAQASFSLSIGGLDSFASAPYLRVSDPDAVLPRLRDALQRISPEIRQADYVPHLTVGLYRQTVPWPQLQARISAFDHAEPLTLQVSDLELCCYHASELFGPLIPLRRIRLQPHPA